MNFVKRRQNFRVETPRVEQLIEWYRLFGCIRVVHNCFIDIMKKSYKKGLKIGLNDAQKAATTELKYTQGYEFLQQVRSVPLQQEVRKVSRSFREFFKSCQGKRSIKHGYPRYLSRKNRQSAEFTRRAFKIRQPDGCKWGFIKFTGISRELKFRASRDIDWDSIGTVTVICNQYGHWEISVTFDFQPEILPEVKQACGVDLGLNSLAAVVTNNGDRFVLDNPRFYRQTEKKIKKANKDLSRKEKGSNNYKKAAKKLNKHHRKAKNQRKYFLDKFSKYLISENQAIGLENLGVSAMASNHKLSKSIYDAAWSMLLHMIEYKGKDAGRTVYFAKQNYPSSQICSICGIKDGKKSLNIRDWTCKNCGAHVDRDFNAAVNLMLQAIDEASEAVRSTDSKNSCGESVRLQLSEATFCEAGTHRSHQ